MDSVAHTLVLPQGSRDHALVQQLTLTVVSGPDAGAVSASANERCVLGSDESADMVLHDASVSRFHCELGAADGRLVVRDLGSRNGTLLDNVSVLVAHVRPGAVLTLGRSQVRVTLGDAPVRVPLSENERFGIMVGRSPAMRRAFALLERVASSNATVLLGGETGTGKEAAAESLHRESPRKDGPFIVVDCGAIPSDLLESELFGHEKGAFTGASAAREGAVAAAHGGTLFLDEIGELGSDLQPKLLRVLERREIKRVGGTRYRPVDVRVIAATHRDLKAEVNARRFRSDLYYRLAVVELRLPALRERSDDLPVLVEHLLASLGTDAERAGAAFVRSNEFLTDIMRHDWPGNVRELRNYLERCLALREAVPLGDGSTAQSSVEGAEVPPIDIARPIKEGRERWVQAFERRYLSDLLHEHGGNVSAAARVAGVDRVQLYRLLWRYGLK